MRRSAFSIWFRRDPGGDVARRVDGDQARRSEKKLSGRSTGKPMGFNGQSCASQLATADVALGRSASHRHLGGYIGRPCDGTERSVPKITFGKNADQ